MKLYDYILENYEPGKIIWAEDIDLGLKPNNKRQQFKTLVDKGLLARVEDGAYAIPKEGLFGITIIPSKSHYYEERFLQRDGRIFGYCNGYCLINKLGLTTQVPFTVEIMSNNISSPVSTFKSGMMTYLVRKSPIEITKDNYHVLQLLDALGNYHIYAEEVGEEVTKLFKKFIDEEKITKADVDKYIGEFPMKTYKGLYDSGVCYVLA